MSAGSGRTKQEYPERWAMAAAIATVAFLVPVSRPLEPYVLPPSR